MMLIMLVLELIENLNYLNKLTNIEPSLKEISPSLRITALKKPIYRNLNSIANIYTLAYSLMNAKVILKAKQETSSY
jgi:hypothetical protein